ncbi:MAG TPA: tetratricopeptide repeat protein [Candidatus Binataceae bacterium]|nr:tetratricopeptide repeat protein [Candidatus Binataceae bacterium]
MSESDGSRAFSGRAAQRRTVVIRRVDHVGDPVGLIFLEPAKIDPDAVIDRLRGYLGVKLRIKKAEVSRDEISVEIESRGWRDEGARLAAAAAELHRNGAPRNALAMYREAMELDPANAEAMCGAGLALAEMEKFDEALPLLKRAHEFGAKGHDITLAMGKCAAQAGRSEAAAAYFEDVLRSDPRNFNARRALRALKRSD